ncbi:MAG: hypothetical protein ACRDVE_04045 [Actinocrinis sp.]
MTGADRGLLVISLVAGAACALTTVVAVYGLLARWKPTRLFGLVLMASSAEAFTDVLATLAGTKPDGSPAWGMWSTLAILALLAVLAMTRGRRLADLESFNPAVGAVLFLCSAQQIIVASLLFSHVLPLVR